MVPGAFRLRQEAGALGGQRRAHSQGGAVGTPEGTSTSPAEASLSPTVPREEQEGQGQQSASLPGDPRSRAGTRVPSELWHGQRGGSPSKSPRTKLRGSHQTLNQRPWAQWLTWWPQSEAERTAAEAAGLVPALLGSGAPPRLPPAPCGWVSGLALPRPHFAALQKCFHFVQKHFLTLSQLHPVLGCPPLPDGGLCVAVLVCGGVLLRAVHSGSCDCQAGSPARIVFLAPVHRLMWLFVPCWRKIWALLTQAAGLAGLLCCLIQARGAIDPQTLL